MNIDINIYNYFDRKGEIVMAFEVMSGTVVGKEHRYAGRNNQDAFMISEENDFLVAVVADGCGSGKYSEVGAQIGCRLIAKSALAQVRRMPDHSFLTDPSFWERVRQDALAEIRVLANQLGGSLSKVIEDYFLFTIIGAAIGPEVSVFFSIGDGVVIINGEITELGPFQKNAPPYLAYDLVGSTIHDGDDFKFKIVCETPTSELDSFLIGTDGVEELISLSEKILPGLKKPMGPISQFWTEDRYFANPDNVRRRLFLANRDMAIPDWENHSMRKENGLLVDDTTLIVGHRERGEIICQ